MSTGRDQPATSSARSGRPGRGLERLRRRHRRPVPSALPAGHGAAARRSVGLPRPALRCSARGPPAVAGSWSIASWPSTFAPPRPREPSRHRALRGQLAGRARRSSARDARRLGLPDRRAARPLRDRARRRPDDRARRPAPVRDRRRDHRLGVPAVRGDRPPHRRDARLARPVSAPGRGSLRPGGPRRRADRPARLVGRQPDRGRRRGAVARRRRDVLAARRRAPAGRGAGPAARHAARRGPARDLGRHRRADPVRRDGRPARAVGPPAGPRRGHARRAFPRSTSAW